MALPSIGVRMNVDRKVLTDANIDIFNDEKKQFSDDIYVDMEKLKKYVKPVLLMRHRSEKIDIHYKSVFKNCELSDYEKLQPEHVGEEEDHESENKKANTEISGRFCPDV